MNTFLRFGRLGTSCVLVMVLLSSCRALSESVIDPSAGLNGGFEIVDSGLPVNWLVYTPRTVPTGDFDLVVDTLQYKGGNQSLMFHVRECSSAGGHRSPGISREYEAEAGEIYTLGFWVQNDGAEFRVRIGGVTAEKGEFETVVQTKETISTWRYYEHQYAMPSGFDRLRLVVNVLSPGTFWIDEISIDGLDGS